jgi:hypothetical protein
MESELNINKLLWINWSVKSQDISFIPVKI